MSLRGIVNVLGWLTFAVLVMGVIGFATSTLTGRPRSRRWPTRLVAAGFGADIVLTILDLAQP